MSVTSKAAQVRTRRAANSARPPSAFDREQQELAEKTVMGVIANRDRSRQRAFARRRPADPPTPRVAPGLELCDPLADRVFGDPGRACSRQDPTAGPPAAPPLPPTSAADAHQAHPLLPTPGTAHRSPPHRPHRDSRRTNSGERTRALSIGGGSNGSPRCRSRSSPISSPAVRGRRYRALSD